MLIQIRTPDSEPCIATLPPALHRNCIRRKMTAGPSSRGRRSCLDVGAKPPGAGLEKMRMGEMMG